MNIILDYYAGFARIGLNRFLPAQITNKIVDTVCTILLILTYPFIGAL